MRDGDLRGGQAEARGRDRQGSGWRGAGQRWTRPRVEVAPIDPEQGLGPGGLGIEREPGAHVFNEMIVRPDLGVAQLVDPQPARTRTWRATGASRVAMW
jgi:hypothetical protein